MTNPRLNPEQLKLTNKLLESIRKKIEKITDGDEDFLFAMRRRVSKKLMHDERGSPMDRRNKKKLKREKQKGKCALCKKRLPKKGAILDRTEAKLGYTDKNTRLLCPKCDAAVQKRRNYTDG